MNVNIIQLDETDSTNNYLKDYQPADPKKMTVVVADHQTEGKGQGTHTWESEAGKNLLFSVLTYPSYVPVRQQFLLSMAGALAVKDALDTYADGFTLKWPNDVYWHDKKISGTLIEAAVGSHGIKRCIFGIGININQTVFLSDAPNPVSLCQIVGHEIDREEVLDKVVEALVKYDELLWRADYIDIAGLYHASLYRRTGYHWYEDKDGRFEGALVEVEDDGHIILHDRTGMIRSYTFGELRFL